MEHWHLVNAKNETIARKAVHFVQLNGAFRHHCKGDKFVDGLAFANATFRKSEFDANRYHHFVEVDNALSGFGKYKFLSLNYISSTAIAVCAIYKPNQFEPGVPVLKPVEAAQYSDFVNTSQNINVESYAYAEVPPTRLYMIELHPERIPIQYGKIWCSQEHAEEISDVDNTKLWERTPM